MYANFTHTCEYVRLTVCQCATISNCLSTIAAFDISVYFKLFFSIVAALFAGTYSAYIHTFVYICIYYCICTTDFDFMLRSLGSASASAVLFAVLSTVNCQMSAVSYAKITMKQDTKEEKKKQNKNLIKKQGKHKTHNKNWGKAFQKT